MITMDPFSVHYISQFFSCLQYPSITNFVVFIVYWCNQAWLWTEKPILQTSHVPIKYFDMTNITRFKAPDVCSKKSAYLCSAIDSTSFRKELLPYLEVAFIFFVCKVHVWEMILKRYIYKLTLNLLMNLKFFFHLLPS